VKKRLDFGGGDKNKKEKKKTWFWFDPLFCARFSATRGGKGPPLLHEIQPQGGACFFVGVDFSRKKKTKNGGRGGGAFLNLKGDIFEGRGVVRGKWRVLGSPGFGLWWPIFLGLGANVSVPKKIFSGQVKKKKNPMNPFGGSHPRGGWAAPPRGGGPPLIEGGGGGGGEGGFFFCFSPREGKLEENFFFPLQNPQPRARVIVEKVPGPPGDKTHFVSNLQP